MCGDRFIHAREKTSSPGNDSSRRAGHEIALSVRVGTEEYGAHRRATISRLSADVAAKPRRGGSDSVCGIQEITNTKICRQRQQMGNASEVFSRAEAIRNRRSGEEG